MASTSFSVIALLALTCPFALGDRDRQQDVVEVADRGHFRRNLGVETLEAALDDANTGACGKSCSCVESCGKDKWKPNANANETGVQDLMNDVLDGHVSRSDCEQALERNDGDSMHYEKICSQKECLNLDSGGPCEPCQDPDSGVFWLDGIKGNGYMLTRKASVKDVEKVCKTCWRGVWKQKNGLMMGNCGHGCPKPKRDEKFWGSEPKAIQEYAKATGHCGGGGKSESSRRQCLFELTYTEEQSSQSKCERR